MYVARKGRVRARRAAAVGALAVLATASITACSSSSKPSGGGSGGGGGNSTLTVALPAVPNNLDINPFGGTPTIQVETALNSTLFAYDTASLPGNGCDEMAGLVQHHGQQTPEEPIEDRPEPLQMQRS